MSSSRAGIFDTVIHGGTLVTADSTADADIGIRDGRIHGIAPDLTGGVTTDGVIDASGLLVLPGAIDVHTHFATTIGDSHTADDFESGSRAASAGGITTVVNFAIQLHGDSLAETVAGEVRKAEAGSHIDVGLHVGVTSCESHVLAEVESLVDAGFTTFKMFTAVGEHALSDAEALALLQAVGDAGGLVMVHAEDGALLDHLSSRLLSQGRDSVRYLNQARPTAAEALAVARIAEYGRFTGCPVYIVHLSCREALDSVRRARSAGAEVYVETRPAYLFLDSSVYDRPDGPKFVTWPPIRGLDDQNALWHGIQVGEIQTYATDHTTWSLAEKMAPGLTFATVPGGVSNVQTSIAMLYSEGVRKGRISLSQMVGLVSTNPAKIFGMWPRKGSLSIGADADIVLIDPAKDVVIDESTMESASDFDPYEGRHVQGWPVLTISRGEVVMAQGKILSNPGRGRIIKRNRFRDQRPIPADREGICHGHALSGVVPRDCD
jgi:dihydropyrimidinase